MKVFIIGSIAENSESILFAEIAQKIGKSLGESEHQIVLCSEQKSSFDYHVLRGLAESTKAKNPCKVIVHHPENSIIKRQWRNVISELKLSSPEYHAHDGPVISVENDQIKPNDNLKFSFIFCQIKAIESCDSIIIVGGKNNGASELLMTIAIQQNISIIPVEFMGGVGKEVFQRLENNLYDIYGHCLAEALRNPDNIESTIINMINNRRAASKKSYLRVFLSYSWKRSSSADYIETILRRKVNITIFRDEHTIKKGGDIGKTITDEIKSDCDIFIGLWCKDYISSPYCYDEVHLWIKERGIKDLYLLRLDDTRPVWPSLRKEQDNCLEFRSNWPQVDNDRDKMENSLNKIVSSFFDEK